MMQYLKVVVHPQLEQKASEVKGSSLFIASSWINDHNSAIFAPINFY